MATRAKSKIDEHDPEALLRAPKQPDFRQERSRRSYLALIDAATALFGEAGYDAIGTPEIAERAGVSVGSFYRYFEDKHEVYLEVARRTMIAGYQKTIEGLGPERFVGRGRHETIAATIDVLFDYVLAQPQLTHSLNEMSLRDPDVGALRRALEAISVRQLTMLISAIIPRTVIPDPEATAHVIHTSAMQVAYSITGQAGTPPIDAERAKQTLTLFIERTLFPGG